MSVNWTQTSAWVATARTPKAPSYATVTWATLCARERRAAQVSLSPNATREGRMFLCWTRVTEREVRNERLREECLTNQKQLRHDSSLFKSPCLTWGETRLQRSCGARWHPLAARAVRSPSPRGRSRHVAPLFIPLFLFHYGQVNTAWWLERLCSTSSHGTTPEHTNIKSGRRLLLSLDLSVSSDLSHIWPLENGQRYSLAQSKRRGCHTNLTRAHAKTCSFQTQ